MALQHAGNRVRSTDELLVLMKLVVVGAWLCWPGLHKPEEATDAAHTVLIKSQRKGSTGEPIRKPSPIHNATCIAVSSPALRLLLMKLARANGLLLCHQQTHVWRNRLQVHSPVRDA